MNSLGHHSARKCARMPLQTTNGVLEMALCPNCGTALETVIATDSEPPTTESAAVEIARINAERDIALARMNAAASAATDEALVAATVVNSETATEIAEIDAEAAIQPGEIGNAVADAIEDTPPAVTVVGDGDVNTGDEIQPLADSEPNGEPEPTDDEPTRGHWLTRSM